MSTDNRYRNRRWKALRLAVLMRDLYRCQVAPQCPVPASVADHIDPVYEGMPDSEFYDPANLRASCKRHNTARGVAARLQRDMRMSERAAPYSFGVRRLQRGRVF